MLGSTVWLKLTHYFLERNLLHAFAATPESSAALGVDLAKAVATTPPLDDRTGTRRLLDDIVRGVGSENPGTSHWNRVRSDLSQETTVLGRALSTVTDSAAGSAAVDKISFRRLLYDELATFTSIHPESKRLGDPPLQVEMQRLRLYQKVADRVAIEGRTTLAREVAGSIPLVRRASLHGLRLSTRQIATVAFGAVASVMLGAYVTKQASQSLGQSRAAESPTRGA